MPSWVTLVEARAIAESLGAKASDITQYLHNKAEMHVNSTLWFAGCTPEDVSDRYDILKHAHVLFLLEDLAKTGKLTVTTGEIKRQTQGRVTTEMQGWYPLFFFGGMDSTVRGENIATMLQHMTYWQAGAYLVNKFCDATVDIADIIQLSSDNTTRGSGWNISEYDPTTTLV